jgi:hypothetical protein
VIACPASAWLGVLVQLLLVLAGVRVDVEDDFLDRAGEREG